MTVWKMEWSEFLGSYGPATRMMAEVCKQHSDLIASRFPNASACGSYEGSCEFCEREARDSA